MGWLAEKNTISHNGGVEHFQANMHIEGDYGIVILINRNVSVYGILTTAIVNILNGKEPPALAAGSGEEWPLRVIGLLVLLFIVRSLYVALRWKKVFKVKGLSIAMHFISVGLLHIAVPLLILIAAPLVLQMSWAPLLSFMPGVTHLAFCASIALLVLGLSRIILLIRSLRRKKIDSLFENGYHRIQ
ncbi:hypothetical protein [Paenibacillus sp. NEAU-GSW1]|uniref:hypothetical protein n=1 Tax=Paenibacillus sp. NEAU-GSW1 TaxID=2682486 RepID=UPI0012E15773|nr:hypothetical protein [Paenibacillus sp. NEAU-GSW1]MUT64823.1 hypothetical protein [Paenibacillus sp. NEAU-GSW1]